MDISGTVLGFLGCGKISSAVARGYASGSGTTRPSKIIVSNRTLEKAQALKNDFPDLVEIADTNEDIVERSNVVFIGLLPDTAAEILPKMPFRDDQLVISMMAAVNYETVLAWTGTAMVKTVRTVPLPSAAVRRGPILSHPPNAETTAVLSIVGTVVECADEAEMKPLVCITGHISHFYEMLQTVQAWSVSNGVAEPAARAFVASFYSSMAQAGEASHESFGAMSVEAATPGGLNAQSVEYLKSTPHYAVLNQSLTDILTRLTK